MGDFKITNPKVILHEGEEARPCSLKLDRDWTSMDEGEDVGDIKCSGLPNIDIYRAPDVEVQRPPKDDPVPTKIPRLDMKDVAGFDGEVFNPEERNVVRIDLDGNFATARAYSVQGYLETLQPTKSEGYEGVWSGYGITGGLLVNPDGELGGTIGVQTGFEFYHVIPTAELGEYEFQAPVVQGSPAVMRIEDRTIVGKAMPIMRFDLDLISGQGEEMFDSGKATLTDAGKAQVLILVGKMEEANKKIVDGRIPIKQLSVLLAGFTDSDGGESGNMRLSRRRAAAVKTAILTEIQKRRGAAGQGAPDPFSLFDESSFHAVGYGETNFKTDAAGVEDKARSRRVEISLFADRTSMMERAAVAEPSKGVKRTDAAQAKEIVEKLIGRDSGKSTGRVYKKTGVRAAFYSGNDHSLNIILDKIDAETLQKVLATLEGQRSTAEKISPHLFTRIIVIKKAEESEADIRLAIDQNIYRFDKYPLTGPSTVVITSEPNISEIIKETKKISRTRREGYKVDKKVVDGIVGSAETAKTGEVLAGAKTYRIPLEFEADGALSVKTHAMIEAVTARIETGVKIYMEAAMPQTMTPESAQMTGMGVAYAVSSNLTVARAEDGTPIESYNYVLSEGVPQIFITVAKDGEMTPEVHDQLHKLYPTL